MIWPGSSYFSGTAGKSTPADWSNTPFGTVIWDFDDTTTPSTVTLALEYGPDTSAGSNRGFCYAPCSLSDGPTWSALYTRIGGGFDEWIFPRPSLGPHRYVFVIDRTQMPPARIWIDGVRQNLRRGSTAGWQLVEDGLTHAGPTGMYYMARGISTYIASGRASVPKAFPYAFTDAQAGEASKPPEYIGTPVIDTVTQGNWGGKYGKDGYRLFAWESGAHLDSRPALPAINDTAAAGVHTWAVNGTDVRSPSHPGQIPLRRRGLVLNPSARDDTTGIRVGPAYNSDNVAIGRMAGIQGIPTGETTCLQVNVPATRADTGWGNFISYNAARGMRSGERGVMRWFQRGTAGGYSGVRPSIANDPSTEVVYNPSGLVYGLTSAWTLCEAPFTAARDLVPGSHFPRFSFDASGAIQTFQIAGFDIVPDPAARNAGTLYEDGTAPPMTVTYNQLEDFEGWLRVYFYDYDTIGRQSTVQLTLRDVTSPAISMTGYSNPGKWISWPVRIMAGTTPTITVTHVANGNSTISALMLDREAVL